eukprot:m.598589 g.598589  ORF g.598589 m.598589 type:complete len:476 (+) comp22422_c0_seq8:221-1648(+)
MATPIKYRELFASGVGNVLEWYDFAVFGALADVIGDVFFPSDQSQKTKLMSSFAIFGAAFIMRPIGGVLFGWLGDKYGRKFSLVASVAMMSIATVLTGCLPGYAVLKGWAPALLAITRLFQGLSAGGELVGSIVYLVEVAPPNKVGLYGSISLWAAIIGTMLGNVVGTAFRESMSDDDLQSWGWRVPFIMGLPIGIVGVVLFNKLEDGEEFTEAKEAGKLATNPFKEACVKYWRETLLVVGVAATWSSAFYAMFIWSQHYMKTLVSPPVPHPFWVMIGGLLFLCVIFPWAGYISDKGYYIRLPCMTQRVVMGRAETMMLGGIGLILFTIPLFKLMTLGNDYLALLALFIFAILISLWGAPMCTWMVEAFPTELRFTAVAIGYNLAQAIFGGSVEVASTALAELHELAPAILLASIALMSVVVIGLWGRRTKGTGSKGYSELAELMHTTPTASEIADEDVPHATHQPSEALPETTV